MSQSSPEDCILDFVCSASALSLCMFETSWSLIACSFTRVQPVSDQAFVLCPPPALPCSLHHKQNRTSTPSAVLSKVSHGRSFLHRSNAPGRSAGKGLVFFSTDDFGKTWSLEFSVGGVFGEVDVDTWGGFGEDDVDVGGGFSKGEVDTGWGFSTVESDTGEGFENDDLDEGKYFKMNEPGFPGHVRFGIGALWSGGCCDEVVEFFLDGVARNVRVFWRCFG